MIFIRDKSNIIVSERLLPTPENGGLTLMDNFIFENNLVIVGIYKESAKSVETFGTGLVISREGKCYVVTCRHVLSELGSSDPIAILKPKRTKKPKNVLRLDFPRFHPQDSREKTFDIAICPIIGYQRTDLERADIYPIEISYNSYFDEPFERLVVEGFGYPVGLIDNFLHENSEQRLPYSRTKGVVQNFSLNNLIQERFSGTLQEGYFAQTEGNNKEIGNGASGGLVCKVNISDLIPIGIILAGAGLANNQTNEIISGLIFAKFERIKETLDKWF